jgi:hypothetical protein
MEEFNEIATFTFYYVDRLDKRIIEDFRHVVIVRHVR